MKRYTALLLVLCCLFTLSLGEDAAPADPAAAATPAPSDPAPTSAPASPAVTDSGLDLLGSSVHYPQLTGLSDAALGQKVNQLIREAGQIETRLSRMSQLISSPTKLTVTYSCVLTEDLFSCAFLASGAVDTQRPTQVFSAVTVDLRTGERVPLSALFTDEAAARAAINEQLVQMQSDLSAHLNASSLLPLPEVFSIDEYALTFYYPIAQFSTLREEAGAVRILWSELKDHLALAEDSVLTRLNVQKHFAFPEDARTELSRVLSGGQFPGVPATLGDAIEDLISRHGEMYDPDIAGDERLYRLEGPAFRGAELMTDRLIAKTVRSIRLHRLSLLGLNTGITTQEAWREALGEPDATVTLDAAEAERVRLVPGQTDYYALSEGIRLCLHGDEGGILRTVILMQTE